MTPDPTASAIGTAPATRRPPTVLLLDVDGTLLDSNEAHTQAWIAALARHGHATTREAVRPLIGQGGDKLLAALFDIDVESPEGRAIDAARREVFARDQLATLRPTNGARALLEKCLASGLRLVVATSSSEQELGALLKQAGIDDLIHAASNADDAEHSKPDPDIVQAALKLAGAVADDAVMLGDTPFDIAAARRAGVPTVALRCGGWWDDAALEGAAAIYGDPAALLADWARPWWSASAG